MADTSPYVATVAAHEPPDPATEPRQWGTLHWRDGEYLVRLSLSAFRMMEVEADMARGGTHASAAILDYMAEVVHPDDWERFRHDLRTSQPPIQQPELSEIVDGITLLVTTQSRIDKGIEGASRVS